MQNIFTTQSTSLPLVTTFHSVPIVDPDCVDTSLLSRFGPDLSLKHIQNQEQSVEWRKLYAAKGSKRDLLPIGASW